MLCFDEWLYFLKKITEGVAEHQKTYGMCVINPSKKNPAFSD